jgi:CBS domain-containing protein
MSLERFTRKPVAIIAPEASIGSAAELMEQRHVGALVVVERDRPIGIVTDRDLALRALGRWLGPNVPVADVMSSDLIVVHEEHRLDEALYVMRRSGVRRLPIVDNGGRLVGMVTLDDLLVMLSGELSFGIEAVMQNRGP